MGRVLETDLEEERLLDPQATSRNERTNHTSILLHRAQWIFLSIKMMLKLSMLHKKQIYLSNK